MINGKFFILMNSGIVIVMFIYMFFALKKNKIKLSGKAELVRKNKIHNKYVRYYNNLLVRKQFRSIVTMFATIGCFSEDKIKDESVTVFERAVLIMILLPIASALAFQNTLLALVSIVIGIVYYNVTIQEKVMSVMSEVRAELIETIESIIQIYQAVENIPISLKKCDKGKYLEHPINQIYEALTTIGGKSQLEIFTRSTPIRQLKTLAEICYVKNTTGAADGEEDTFCKELTLVRQELDSYVRRDIKTKISFKSLKTIILIGIVAQPIVDIFVVKIMPGTSVIIKGMYGNLEKVCLLVATALILYFINAMKNPSVVNQVDKIWAIDVLSQDRRMKDFIGNFIPKKFKTREKMKMRIRDSISSKTLEYIYTLKVIAASSAFIISIILMFLFALTSKEYLKHNYKSLSFSSSSKYTEEQYVQVKEVDKQYMSQKEKMSDDDAYKLVKNRIKGLNEMNIQDEVSRLSTKYDKMHKMGFKWYYIVLAYLIAVVAWYSPELSLMFRKSMAQYEAVEDVMQLQTMCVVLSSSDMSVRQALYWLASQASVHKAPLRYAYHSYSSNPEETLKELKNTSMIADFKNIVTCLQSAAYTLSLKEAFTNMTLIKNQSLAKQDMIQDEALMSKIIWAKMLSKTPLMIVLFLGFLGPVVYLAVTNLGSMISQLNGSGGLS